MSFLPRVAFVTGGLRTGGSTTFLCNLAGEFVRRGIPVRVLSFESDNPLESDFRTLGIPAICCDDRRLIMEDRAEAILANLADFKPTVVLANLGAVSFEVLRYVPQGAFRIGVIHSDDPRVYRMVSFYHRCLDAIAAVSKKIVESVSAMPEFASVPIKHLPLGVPMPSETQSPRVKDADAPLRILYLGRLDQEQKRVRLFPQILEHLTGIPFHWTIAGEGPEKGFLENSMKTSSPQQTVSFTGKVNYAGVPELISGRDIFLLASDYEGLPLALLEAMGHGLVPVVSDLPSGIREVVNENTGILVATTDVPGYAKGIIRLHQNREALKKLSENARRAVLQDFSVQAMANRWLEAFPPTPAGSIAWPDKWHIKPPLGCENLFRFSPTGRMLRRLKYALRA